MKTSGFLTAALVAATAITAPQPSAAQYARDGGLMAVLNREIARSSEFLEQMWDLAFGREEATRGEDPVRVVVVVEEPQTRAEALTLEDRTLACRVAVQLVEEQAVLKLEAARLATRLRVPQNGGVNVQLVDATTCAELERPALVAECQRVSETMDEQIVALLKYGTSHQEICETLVTTAAPPLSCKLCKRFVQMVDDAIAQDMAHVQQVREILGDICDSMAADSMCHTFLKQYDDVVDWLRRGTDPEAVCERLTMCTVPTQGEVTNMALTPAKDVSAICDVRHGCFYCVQISSVVGFVAKNAPGQLDNLRTILKYVCKLTPKSCKCDEAEKNFDKIVDLTHKGKRPKEICVAIGLCEKESEKSKLLELVGKPEMAEAMSALVLATPPADEKTCFYCDYAVTLLEVAMRQDETSLDTIREYADMICGMLGENSVCHKYVDKLDYAIDGLKNGKKPRDICTQMKFCAKKKNVKVLPKTAAETINVAASTLALTDDKKCFYCDYFTTLIEVAIQENQDAVEEIRQYADMICGMLGDDNLCHQYVDKLDFVVDAINQGKKPRKICVELKFCSKKSAAPASTAMVLRDDKKCFYCDYFVTLIEVALQEDDDDIEAIQLYADVVCGMLGEQSTCHQYVDNLDYVVDALKKGKKPRQICTEMKFCNAKSLPALPEGVDMSPQLEHVVSKSIGVASNLTLIDDCFFCTQIANLFKVAIGQDPEQVSEIRMVADMICNVLSADNKCHDVMQKIDHIIDSITKGQEPGSICRDMHFCPKATLPFPLPKKLSTGGNNCAYCDGVATVLEYALKSKPEQVEQIREAAGIVCDFMPADDKCHDDLKMFDKAVKDLRSGKSPHEVCKELKFCESSLLTESKMMPLSAAKLDRIDAMTKAKAKAVDTPKSMSMGCLLCEYTAEVLTRVHGSESETRLARKTLQTMCVVLPPNAKCDVISSKFDDLIQLIGEGKSPSQACHALSFCDAAFVDPSPKKEIAEIMAVKV